MKTTNTNPTPKEGKQTAHTPDAALLPNDKEVTEWYDLNIDESTATVSSSIYKFRLFLKERLEKIPEPSNKKWHPVEFAGFWHIMDEPFYDANDVLNSDNVGYEQARANAQLIASAPTLLAQNEALREREKELISALEKQTAKIDELLQWQKEDLKAWLHRRSRDYGGISYTNIDLFVDEYQSPDGHKMIAEQALKKVKEG